MADALRVNLGAFIGEAVAAAGGFTAMRTRVDYASAAPRPWAAWIAEIDACIALPEIRDGNAPIEVYGRCPAALAVLFSRKIRTGTRKLTYVDTLRGEDRYVVNNNESAPWHLPDSLTPMRMVETIDAFVAPSLPPTVIIFLNFGLERKITPQQLGTLTPLCVATWRPVSTASPLFKSDDALAIRDNLYVLMRNLHRNYPAARFGFATTGPIAAAMLFATVYNVHIYGKLALFELVNGVYAEVA